MLVVADEDGSDFVGQSPLGHIAACETGSLLNVARSTGGNAVASKDEFLGNASTVRLDQIRFQLLASNRYAVVFGKRPCYTESTTARHDRDFVQGIVALDFDRADGVATLVVGGELALFVLHHHRLALGAHHDLVLRVLEVGHVDLVVVATGSQ